MEVVEVSVVEVSEEEWLSDFQSPRNLLRSSSATDFAGVFSKLPLYRPSLSFQRMRPSPAVAPCFSAVSFCFPQDVTARARVNTHEIRIMTLPVVRSHSTVNVFAFSSRVTVTFSSFSKSSLRSASVLSSNVKANLCWELPASLLVTS